LIAPAAVEMIGKKKRMRGKKEEVSTSSVALVFYAPKQRKRRVKSESPQAPGACIFLSLI
jgi:hypothetical protein